MDMIKAALAATVQDAILKVEGVNGLPTETRIVSDLSTRVKVKTPTGTRFFTVTVKEDF